ncbi:hypothetical protein Clacol_006896 [Clathrus columnatus]|uniref:Uncharacterized protein n=1 Tax=Clathrus columnatus TaxID=1419009 RepID=A0AAV5AFZ4_9AGAM|nr:hypothetical protein Clacol_006896 [Clathrus columnatus]
MFPEHERKKGKGKGDEGKKSVTALSKVMKLQLANLEGNKTECENWIKKRPLKNKNAKKPKVQ